MAHNQESFLDNEQDEVDWADYITQFKDEVFPLFKHQGFTLSEALIVWKLNEIGQRLSKLQDNWND